MSASAATTRSSSTSVTRPELSSSWLSGCRKDVDEVLARGLGDVAQAQRMLGAVTLLEAFAPSADGTYPDADAIDAIGRAIARSWERELETQLPDSDHRVEFVPFHEDGHGTVVGVVRR